MQICLPESVKYIINKLKCSGFEAYMVGGSVRDCLLGRMPDDFDVCTNALPDDILKLFKKTVPTGIKHGTVTVISDGEPVEVTTFRTESEYKDFRHPQNVKFVRNLKDDLSRRDFTVNAMCYSEESGIIDYFGGLCDLENKTLRAIGDPDKRFREDALRILRLFRFACTLGFKIENKTYCSAIKNAQLLKNISAERIREELLKTACSNNPGAFLPLIKSGALSFLKPSGKLQKLSKLPQNYRLRFFAFLKITSKDLNKTLEFLKCSNAFKLYSQNMDLSTKKCADTKPDIKRLLSVLEKDIFDLFCYKSAILGEDTKEQKIIAEQIIKGGEPYIISQLAVNGNDIKAKGYAGAEISEILIRLLDTVIQNPELNSKEKLSQLF